MEQSFDTEPFITLRELQTPYLSRLESGSAEEVSDQSIVLRALNKAETMYRREVGRLEGEAPEDSEGIWIATALTDKSGRRWAVKWFFNGTGKMIRFGFTPF